MVKMQFCIIQREIPMVSTTLLWEIMLEQRLTQRVLFLLPCRPNSKGRKHFPKWFILKTLSPTRDSHEINHWGSDFLEKHSKFLLFLPSIVTSLNLDRDKESSRKNTTSKGKKGSNDDNSILITLSIGNMGILMVLKKCVRGSAGFLKM